MSRTDDTSTSAPAAPFEMTGVSVGLYAPAEYIEITAENIAGIIQTIQDILGEERAICFMAFVTDDGGIEAASPETFILKTGFHDGHYALYGHPLGWIKVQAGDQYLEAGACEVRIKIGKSIYIFQPA